MDLEDELGVRLLDRDNRNVHLTPAGRYLQSEVGQMQDRINRIRKNVQLIDRGEIGELRIGFVGSAMQILIPSALKKMDKDFPGIHANLQELSNSEQMDAILADKLDVGFVRSEHFSSGIAHLKVLEENFVLVLPNDHWMTSRNFKNIQQLKNEKFILFGTSYSQDYYDLIISVFLDHGFKPEVSHRSVHASTIFHLVESHLGIGIVPASLTTGFALNIRFIELKKIPQKTRLHMIWKSDNINQMLKNFTDYFKRSAN